MADKKFADPEHERAVELTTWFSVLIHSRYVNDFQEAATAQERLTALGVTVRFHRPSGGQLRRRTAGCSETHNPGGGTSALASNNRLTRKNRKRPGSSKAKVCPRGTTRRRAGRQGTGS